MARSVTGANRQSDEHGETPSRCRKTLWSFSPTRAGYRLRATRKNNAFAPFTNHTIRPLLMGGTGRDPRISAPEPVQPDAPDLQPQARGLQRNLLAHGASQPLQGQLDSGDGR